MKITPKTSNAGSGSTPGYFETLKYTVELTGAELYALRSVARHISSPPGTTTTTTRWYTNQLASLDIPGLPDPDDGPCWHEGSVEAKRLSDLGGSEVEGLEAVEWWNPAGAPEPEPEPEPAKPSKPTEPNRFEKGDKVCIIGLTPYPTRGHVFGRTGTVHKVDRDDPAGEYEVLLETCPGAVFPDGGWFPGSSLERAAEPADDIAPGFNPARFTRAEVDPKNEGWRLLSQAEVSACTQSDERHCLDPEGFEFPGFPGTQYNTPDGWSKTGTWYAYTREQGDCGTLRTRRPEGYYLTRRTGVHNPAKLEPSQVGDGWRLLTVHEVRTEEFWPRPNSQYWRERGGWSTTGTWRAYGARTGTLRVRK